MIRKENNAPDRPGLRKLWWGAGLALIVVAQIYAMYWFMRSHVQAIGDEAMNQQARQLACTQQVNRQASASCDGSAAMAKFEPEMRTITRSPGMVIESVNWVAPADPTRSKSANH